MLPETLKLTGRHAKSLQQQHPLPSVSPSSSEQTNSLDELRLLLDWCGRSGEDAGLLVVVRCGSAKAVVLRGMR